MSTERSKTKIDSALDSAVIRLDLLQRSQMTSQGASATEDQPAGLDAACSVRRDARKREVLLHPFDEGSK